MDSQYSVSRTVCFLNRGESFGELGLLTNAPRQATVISKEPVELLVFGDEVKHSNCHLHLLCFTNFCDVWFLQDYIDIFMGGGIKTADPFIA